MKEKKKFRILEDMFKGTSFDDFLFRPQYSSVDTRKVIGLAMPLTRNITIKVPIIGANMDTVTREKMMKTLALEGCFGFIDRNCSIQEQADRVQFVKRQHSYIIEKPSIISRRHTVAQAKQVMKANSVSGLLVESVLGSGVLVGILTHRDILAAGDDDLSLIEKYMTHLSDLVTAQPDISMEEAERLMLEKRVEKLPLVSRLERKICGLITLKDLSLAKQKPYSTKDKKGRLMVGATIGARGDYMERAEALITAGTDCILIDIAHADSRIIGKAVQNFRAKFKYIDLVCGNVATREGAQFLSCLGVDAIKVGVGPGRGCRTRLETGAGVPQLQAIRETFLEVGQKIPIIADGGIKNDKDIVLAILCGASTVMLGSMLSGTDEAPGELIEDPVSKKKVKIYRGMTSPEAVFDGSDVQDSLEERFNTPAEGQAIKVDYVGSVIDIIRRIKGHLQSAVSYAGESNLWNAHDKVSNLPENYLVRLSEASKRESFER